MSKLNKQEQKEILDKLLECQADIDEILQRLGNLKLYDCSFSLREVAHILDISKTRVKQIESKAMKKISKELKDKGVA
ncbi:sigma factor-like helix-turn-helix DNA-binding protein [Sulfurospirillum sp. 1307]